MTSSSLLVASTGFPLTAVCFCGGCLPKSETQGGGQDEVSRPLQVRREMTSCIKFSRCPLSHPQHTICFVFVYSSCWAKPCHGDGCVTMWLAALCLCKKVVILHRMFRVWTSWVPPFRVAMGKKLTRSFPSPAAPLLLSSKGSCTPSTKASNSARNTRSSTSSTPQKPSIRVSASSFQGSCRVAGNERTVGSRSFLGPVGSPSRCTL